MLVTKREIQPRIPLSEMRTHALVASILELNPGSDPYYLFQIGQFI